MRLRIDDFPVANQKYVDIDHIFVLNKIADIIDSPFLIGVVPISVSKKMVIEISKIAKIAVHGVTHYRGYLDSLCKDKNFGTKVLKNIRYFLKTEIFIPPFNWIPKGFPELLLTSGYKTLCIAKRKDGSVVGNIKKFPINLKIFTTVYSSTYFTDVFNTSFDLLRGDCITLHYIDILNNMEAFKNLIIRIKEKYPIFEVW